MSVLALGMFPVKLRDVIDFFHQAISSGKLKRELYKLIFNQIIFKRGQKGKAEDGSF